MGRKKENDDEQRVKIHFDEDGRVVALDFEGVEVPQQFQDLLQAGNPDSGVSWEIGPPISQCPPNLTCRQLRRKPLEVKFEPDADDYSAVLSFDNVAFPKTPGGERWAKALEELVDGGPDGGIKVDIVPISGCPPNLLCLGLRLRGPRLRPNAPRATVPKREGDRPTDDK